MWSPSVHVVTKRPCGHRESMCVTERPRASLSIHVVTERPRASLQAGQGSQRRHTQAHPAELGGWGADAVVYPHFL